jgi:energy-coupling factor transporter ATP-binding protein EcfA2
MGIRLTGRNVQPWEEFALDIGGLTLIVGPSNHGKSSIFRALRGVLRNDLPSDFVRNGQDGRLEVVLETEGTDPIKATRTRKGTTKYEIGRDEKGKPIKYEALGDSIPEPMRKLGFGRVQVGETTIDPIFSEQNRAQFLIDPERWKPADLSSVLGAFSSTERLDAGKKEAGLRITQRNAEARTLAEEIRETEERRGRLSRLSEEAEAELGRAGSFEQLVGRYGSQGLAIASVLAATGRLCSLRRLASGIVVPDLSVTEGLRRRVDLLSEAAYRSRRLAFLSGLADAGLAVQGQWEGIAQEGRLLQAVLSLLGMVGRKGLGPRACAERLGVLLRGTDSSLSSVLRLSSVIRAAGSVREARQLSALKEDDLRRTEESLRQADAEAARLGADLARVSVPRCPVHGVELACPLCSRPDDSNNPL